MNLRSSGEGMIAPPRLLSCIHRETFVASLVLVPIHLCMPLVILTRNPAHQLIPSCSGVLENIEDSDGDVPQITEPKILMLIITVFDLFK